jgi:hypothetical protein
MVLIDSLHKPDVKMFAIINKESKIVEDACFADSIEEAQSEFLDKIIIEVTLENSPFQYGEIRNDIEG